MRPKVSCVCPTYGRGGDNIVLLQEAVESFCRQDYDGPSELVILNDCDVQKFSCDVKNVRVVNTPTRSASLGVKYNIMIELLSDGDVILPWEDDDISLPWRISQAVEMLCGVDYFNPLATWFLDYTNANPDGPGLHFRHKHGVCHNASAYWRSTYKKVGRYPPQSGIQDQIFDREARRIGRVRSFADNEDPSRWAYIYRWGVSPIHLSADQDGDRVWSDAGRLAVLPGAWNIEPLWRCDYVALTVDRLRNI